MKKFYEIQAMTIEQLAKFLICEGVEADYDEDSDGNIYDYTVSCYYTPFCIFPGWMDEEDVKKEVIKILLSEEPLFDEDGY